ncbi:hypothetical protein [Micrococcus yunnanensis]|nr:hypothetical protein [Micrococcus yunnanensis]
MHPRAVGLVGPADLIVSETGSEREDWPSGHGCAQFLTREL